jgi:hypothetical protein
MPTPRPRPRRPVAAPRQSAIVDAVAECQDCDWHATTKNAAPIAATHAARTGHLVVAQATIVTHFNPRRSPNVRAH